MGLVCASVYILLLILFIPFAFSPVSLSASEAQYTVREGIVVNAFPHYQVRYLPFPVRVQTNGNEALSLPILASLAADRNNARLFGRRL